MRNHLLLVQSLCKLVRLSSPRNIHLPKPWQNEVFCDTAVNKRVTFSDVTVDLMHFSV
jgi:hypothetical protein